MTSATRKRPISKHPAFRWVVAAYFALLVGGGLLALLVVRNDLFLDFHARQPVLASMPIGIVGKAILASGGALIGFLLGFVLASRIAALGEAGDEDFDDSETDAGGDVWLDDAGADPEPEPEVLDHEPRRPFNPREYLADEGIEAWDGAAQPDDAEAEDRAGSGDDHFEIEDYLPEAVAAREEPADLEDVDDDEEWLPEAAVIAPVEAPPAAGDEPAAFGDLSLAELASRLERALAAQRETERAGAARDAQDPDPVIAFLRREADRASPARGDAEPSGSDPQAALRGALDRLSKVSNPR